MHDAAVISGSLVDAKNVNTHKVMRLIIDVPAENALKVIAAFGWPTMVNPVSVAVARLDERKVVASETRSIPAGSSTGRDATPRPDQSVGVPAGADKSVRILTGPEMDDEFERRAPKSPAQIAGYLCTTPLFQAFLRERFEPQWLKCTTDTYNDAETAAAVVRELCKVYSRADLTDKNTEWNALQLAFRVWENHPELEDA